MALILLRHTRPEGGDGLCYGRTELDLAADWMSEAANLLDELPAVTVVATSPLRRAHRLAAFIAEARELPLAVDPRLAEIDFGTWEGRRWDAIPSTELDAWAADMLGARPHGGESVAMLSERVASALADWRKEPGPVLMVSHSGVARAALALGGARDAWTHALPYGGWIRL